MSEIKLRMLKNGPILVEGTVEIVDAKGKTIAGPQNGFALCRCGASSAKPFCDGAHSKINFDGTIGVGPFDQD